MARPTAPKVTPAYLAVRRMTPDLIAGVACYRQVAGRCRASQQKGHLSLMINSSAER